MRAAIYPGTFDPITNGHLDIAVRASKLFDKVIIAISNNPHKNPLFSLEERAKLVRDSVSGMDRFEIDVFDDLLVKYAERRGISVIISGLRAISDFEYEFQMALMNRKLMPKLETVYLMPGEKYTYLNSTIVKEIARLGGNVDQFLPDVVVDALMKKIGRK